jgi:AbrB family looped-hinge helix DNA binding protein
MKNIKNVVEITRASSKGQIVIPKGIRQSLDMKSGSLFIVTERNKMIILKKLDQRITKEDMKTLKLVEEAWKDLESGKYKIYPKDEFFKEFSKW